MFKRIIADVSKKFNRKGYTMTELLVAVGILAVLCAIAIPSIIAISRSLAFKEANEYAESIFMAAQDNLTEMRSEGRLIELQTYEGGAEKIADLSDSKGFPIGEYELNKDQYMYCTSEDAVFDILLPVNSIDSAVRDGNILIEYNPYTGNVYSVFYCKRGGELSYAEAEGKTEITRDEDERKPLRLGYYCGSTLSGIPITADETEATISYDNGEEGVVSVSVPVPAAYKANRESFIKGLEVSITVTAETLNADMGSNRSITVTAKRAGDLVNASFSDDGKSVVVDYRLDSLYQYSSFASFGYCNGEGAGEYGINVQGFAGTDSKVKKVKGLSYIDLDNVNLTNISDEDDFNIYPGENVSISAEVSFQSTSGRPEVEITAGTVSGVNPMFESLVPSPTDKSKYVITVANGRQLQNLNAIAPAVSELVKSVVFTDDIDWQETVDYYNEEYGKGGTYSNYDSSSSTCEAPARALPYFVPINNEELFGSAKFIYPKDETGLWNTIKALIQKYLNIAVNQNSDVPTLTDELDLIVEDGTSVAAKHASIMGNSHEIYNIKIDSDKYDLGAKYYAGTADANVDKFTGVFGYVNTYIRGLSVVNPSIKGASFSGNNNPATGALVGACGFNTLITNCSTYIDTTVDSFQRGLMASGVAKQAAYNVSGDYYGVRGCGAVGGLVGYAKSHRTVTEELTNDEEHLAFSNCFAAIPVSGHMRGENTSAQLGKYYGYTNGVGGLVGNAEISNFYNCYSSGDVVADGIIVTNLQDETGVVTAISDTVLNALGADNVINFFYNGRTSMGAGGFVGTSHGVRYTNCFASGDVLGTYAANASALHEKKVGAGGFVGIMSYEETLAYGNDNASTTTDISQQTVFQNVYAVGNAKLGGENAENFSGANCRIKFDNYSGTAKKYWSGSYYAVYAPWWFREHGSVVDGIERLPYESFIYKDSYYISKYTSDSTDNTNACAEAIGYSKLTDLTGMQNNAEWIQTQIKGVKSRFTASTVESVMKMFKIPDDYKDDVREFTDKYGFSMLTYGGVYFGDWVNEDITYTYLKDGLSDVEGALGYAALRAGFGYEKYCTTYTNERYAISGWNSGLNLKYGSLIAQLLIQNSVDDNGNGVRWQNQLSSNAKEPGAFEISKWIEYDYKHFYNTLSELEGIYTALYKEGFPASDWQAGNVSGETHGYDLNTTANYPFSKLRGMDYYGRWPAKSLADDVPYYCGLAYYEQYEDGSYGYYFDRDSTSTLDNSKTVVSDGYAVLSSFDKVTVQITDRDGVSTGSSTKYTHYYDGELSSTATVTIDGTVFKVAYLPWEAIDRSEVKDGNFYYRIKVSNTNKSAEGERNYTMYFNPNAALTQINPVNNGSTQSTYNAAKPSKVPPTPVYIRTARQLAELSDGLKEFVTEGVTYQQMLNIDASAYTAASYTNSSQHAAAIVNAAGAESFNATYTGVGGYVEKANITGFTNPIFSSIGSKGVVKEISVTLNGGSFGSSSKENVGLLAAVNGGTVSNVDAMVYGTATVTAKTNAGVLVGLNNGTVSGCTSTLADVTVNAVNAGGLMGCSEDGKTSGCTVKLTKLSSANAENLGGLAGKAVNSELVGDDVSVDTAVTGNTNAGGLVGLAQTTAINKPAVTVNGSITADAVAAGLAGAAKNSTVTNADVTLGGFVGARTAAGLIGTSEGTSVSVIKVTIANTGVISGSEKAAGAIGTADAAIKADKATLSGNVFLNGKITSAYGSAAGFVVESYDKISNARVCMPDTAELGASIVGNDYAAGMACGIFASTTDSYVNGKGTISANSAGDAAGFAINAESTIKGCYVTPVRHDIYDYVSSDGTDMLKQAYLDNDISNLVIEGKNNGAGFIINIKGSVENCTAAATVIGGSSAGFAVNLSEKAAVTGCTANSVLGSTGRALVCNPEGSVTNCYAWYDGGMPDNVKYGVKEDEGDISKHYYACYFAPIDVPDDLNKELDGIVTVCLGDKVDMLALDTLATLDVEELCPTEEDSGVNNIWKLGGKDTAYPFDEELIPKNYAYPMLRQHYGDWVNPTQYAYGVAYYEILDDGSLRLALHDLSNPDINEWSGNLSLNTLTKVDEGTIADTGYLVFYRRASQILTDREYDSIEDEELTEAFSEEQLADIKSSFAENLKFTALGSTVSVGANSEQLEDLTTLYSFRKLNGTENFSNLEEDTDTKGVIEAFELNGFDDGVHNYVPSFADAVFYNCENDGAYEIRTEQQFNNMGAAFTKDTKHTVTAAAGEGTEEVYSFNQTHDITLSEQSRSLNGCFTGNVTYDGMTLNAEGKDERCTIDAGAAVYMHSSMFGTLGGDGKAELKNLVVKNATFDDTGELQEGQSVASRGILTDEVKKDSKIINCELVDPAMKLNYWGSKDSGYGSSYGAFTANNSGTIESCTIIGSGNDSVFSIDASAMTVKEKGKISDTEQVARSVNVGGIVGYNTPDGVLKDCIVIIDISYSPAVVDTDKDATALFQTVRLGGVVGINEGVLTNSAGKKTVYNGDLVYNSLELEGNNKNVAMSSTIFVGGIAGENIGTRMTDNDFSVYGDVLYTEPHIEHRLLGNNADKKSVTEEVYVGGAIGRMTLSEDREVTGGLTNKISLLGGDDNDTDKVGESLLSNIGIVNADVGDKLEAIGGKHYVGGTVGVVDGKINASKTRTVTLQCYADNANAAVNVLCVPASEVNQVGGAVGSVNSGDKSTHMAVSIVNDKNGKLNANITVDEGDTKVLCVGGIVGITVKNVEKAEDFKSNQKVSANYAGDITVKAVASDGCYVGGIAGYSSYGSITGFTGGSVAETAKGSITMVGDAAKVSGRNAYVGGAIGFANNPVDDAAKFSNVKANMNIKGSFASTGVTADTPSGYANVGRFVGYTMSGAFENCYGFGVNCSGEYQFLGTVKMYSLDIQPSWYELSGVAAANSITIHTKNNSGTHSAFENSTAVFTPASGQYQLSAGTTLTNAKYKDNDGNEHTQYIENTKYFYTKDKQDTVWRWQRTEQKSYSGFGADSSQYLITDATGKYTLTYNNGDGLKAVDYGYGDKDYLDFTQQQSNLYYTDSVWKRTSGGGLCTVYAEMSSGGRYLDITQYITYKCRTVKDEVSFTYVYQNGYFYFFTSEKMLGSTYNNYLLINSSNGDVSSSENKALGDSAKLKVYKLDSFSYYNTTFNQVQISQRCWHS